LVNGKEGFYSRKQEAKRDKEENWYDKSKVVVHFKDRFYNALQFEVGMRLFASGFGKFNKHHFEYKKEKEVVILVKGAVVRG
jgi:hypothetical protein